MKKYIDPLFSVAIILAVFTLFLFIIIHGQASLNKQLSATIFRTDFLAPETNIGEQVADKIGNRAGVVALSECLRSAYNDFVSRWNEECGKIGAEEKCDLPQSIADDLEIGYQSSQNSCYSE